MKYSIVVIGAGNIGERHLNAIKEIESLEPVAIVDVNQEKAEELAKSFQIKSYQNYQDVLKERKPDIAVIALPHFLHKEVAINCIQQGCHVLIEKPMAMNVAESEIIIEESKKNNVCVMVCHTQQYMAVNKKIKKIIESGKLGEVIMVNDRRYIYYFDDQRSDWFFLKEKAGGGIVINMGTHSIDKIQWITDSKISNVKAMLSDQNFKGNIEGSGLIYLEMTEQSGRKFPVTIALSGYYGVPETETEFICTHGKLKITDDGVFINEQNSQEFQPVEIEESESPSVLQLENLIHLIENRNKVDDYNDYAKSVVNGIEMIYRSSNEEREINLSSMGRLN